MQLLANVDELANELLLGGDVYRKMGRGLCPVSKGSRKDIVSIFEQLQNVRSDSIASWSTYFAFLAL